MSLVVERTENLGWPCKKKQHIELSSHSLTHSQKQNSYLQSHPYLSNPSPICVFQYIHFPSKTHNFPSAAAVVVMVSLPKRVATPLLHRTEGAGNVPSLPRHLWSHPGLHDQLKIWWESST